MPSLAHFIYIPGVLILGLVLGFIWGAKATRETVLLEQKREDERAARRAAREARQASTNPPSTNPAGTPPSDQG